MYTTKFCLFRRLQVQRDASVVQGLDARKVQELLGYLLIHRDHLHSREMIANMLWEDCTTSQSKKHLRQTLWHLQSALDTTTDASDQPLVLADTEYIGINPDAAIWVDTAEFEQVYVHIDGIPPQELEPENAETLRQTIQLYRGDLLQGWYYDWCLYHRERFQNMYLSLLNKLIDYCERRADYTAGIEYCERILFYDRAHERTHQQLIRLHYMAGNRTAALRQYERCATALKQELDVKPAWYTNSLYQLVKSDQLSIAALPLEGKISPLDVDEILAYLKQIQTSLVILQQHVQGYVGNGDADQLADASASA